MVRRIIAFALATVISLTPLIPTQIAQAGELPHNSYDSCDEIPELYGDTDAAQKKWARIVPELPTGTQPRNKDKYPFNFKIWHDKHLVVYGNYASLKTNNSFKPGTQIMAGVTDLSKGYYAKYIGDTLVKGEWRYHGFDYEGNWFTNMEFINDADSQRKLSSKSWIYHPWDSSLVTPRLHISKITESSLTNPVTQSWINAAIPFTIADKSANAYQYMHVLSPPNLLYGGSGRMWHKIRDGNDTEIWYQTFAIPKQKDKLPTPVETNIIVNNKPSDFSFVDFGKVRDNDIITLDITVEATLKDEAYYNDPINKVNYYTRYDVDYWYLTLNGVKKRVDSWSRNKATSKFKIDLTKKQIKELLNNTYRLSAVGQAIFYNNKTSQDDKQLDKKFEIVPRQTPNAKISMTIKNPPSDFVMSRLLPATTKKTLDIDVEITLLDEAYYKDPNLRTKWRTRYDLREWVITLNNEQRRIDKISNNVGKATFKINLTKGYIEKLTSLTYPLEATGYAIFNDQESTQTVKTTKQVTFTLTDSPPITPTPQVTPTPGIPATPTPTPTPSATPGPAPTPEILIIPVDPVLLIPQPNVPEIAFDTIPFVATDNTDMSTIETRQVFIDSVPVNDVEFFSGNYIFGDGNTGLKQVRIDYTGQDGLSCQAIEWIMVYPTKPRAQFKLEGIRKQNRKMTLTNTSLSANDQIVLDSYPIVSYEWSYEAVEGNQTSMRIRQGTETELFKELMYKEPGVYKIALTSTNSLGRKSDPYVLQFVVTDDIAPAIEMNLDSAVLARGESLNAWHYAVSSTDGDTIVSNAIEIWYDSDNNGTYDQLVNSYTANNGFASYTPTKLGKYKIINKASEEFGQETLAEFVTPSDRKQKNDEQEVLVDNYIPMTDLYTDVPINRPEIDVLFMLDANLDTNKNNYVQTSKMDFANYLRSKNILPQVNIWDMHTYTYSQSASESVHYGTTYPPDTRTYTSNGYSGTLNRAQVSNNSYQSDFGSNQTKTESLEFKGTHANKVRAAGRTNPWVEDSKSESPAPSSLSINTDGYSGSIPRTETKCTEDYFINYGETYYDSATKTSRQPWNSGSTWTAYYAGVLTKTVTLWVSDWRWVNDYTATYSGTVYKNVRQPYVDTFRPTTQKYIVYVSDNNITELNDLKAVLSKCDAKLILIGTDAIKSQIGYHKYIANSKPIDQLLQETLEQISAESPAIAKYYVLAGQDAVPLQTANYDPERDTIVKEEYQYVHNPNYFDNPQGLDTFAVSTYSDTSWITSKVEMYNKPGEYHIYRRIKDLPTNDVNFANFSYYSGPAELLIYAHRKPIARCSLTWDFDAATHMYNTTWVDGGQSYDLDHQYTMTNKGIVDSKIMYRLNGGEWIYKIPDQLAPGTYELNYYVKDVEGVWSDAYIMNFTLPDVPPMQFDCQLRTLDSNFSTSSIPASEYLEVYNAWTRFPYNVYLTVALYNGATQVVPTKTIYYSAATGTKNGNDINWNSISYQIPATVQDGPYTLRVTAIGDYSQTLYKNFPVTVRTPINPIGAINAKTSGSTITSDEVNTFSVTTSKYATSVSMDFKGNTYRSSTGDFKLVQNGTNKVWEMQMNVPSTMVQDGETGNATFTATIPSNRSENDTVDYNVIGISAYDFTITSILDIAWRGYYFDLNNPINGDGERYGYPKRTNTDIKTIQMPVNALGLVQYSVNSVKAGYKIKGYIRVKGNVDTVRFTANYLKGQTTCTETVSTIYRGNQVYEYTWIIPEDVTQNSYIWFDVTLTKGIRVYGNEKWYDNWAALNPSRFVVYVRGKASDDIQYTQSN